MIKILIYYVKITGLLIIWKKVMYIDFSMMDVTKFPYSLTEKNPDI
jgi:hypothetical protein